MSIIVNITGQVESIKGEKKFNNTYLTEFIVSSKNGERTHLFIVKSFSPGEFDKYAIINLIGREVELQCYLNGRKTEGAKGAFYNNELHVKELRLL